jgi:hypothetical protein
MAARRLDEVTRAIRDAVGPATGTEKYARLVLGRLERDGLTVEEPGRLAPLGCGGGAVRAGAPRLGTRRGAGSGVNPDTLRIPSSGIKDADATTITL